MVANSRFTNKETLGDLAILKPLAKQGNYFVFTRCECGDFVFVGTEWRGTPTGQVVEHVGNHRPFKPHLTRMHLLNGALSRATGIPPETLRTWEQRYGFPVPERKPSGDRVYPMSSVPRLRRIAEALARGHRAREAVSASEQALSSLLTVGPVEVPPRPGASEPGESNVVELLRFVETFDAEQLTRTLLRDWKRQTI